MPRETRMAVPVNFSRWFADARHALCQQKQLTSLQRRFPQRGWFPVGGKQPPYLAFPEVLEDE